MSIPTPHNKASKEQIAKTVIMPGDPMRSKMNLALVNNVRNVQGYTGTYKGVPVTVMASGMGHPSIGIYSYELFHFYDIDQIIRVGSIGAVSDATPLRSLIIAEKAYSSSNYNNFYAKNGNRAGYVYANKELCSKAEAVAQKMDIDYKLGPILSSDTFYTDEDEMSMCLKLGLLGVEMESLALYLNANKCGKKALTICTVSNIIPKGIDLPSEDRQNGFKDMARVALELI